MVSHRVPLEDLKDVTDTKITFADGGETTDLKSGTCNFKLSTGNILKLKDVLTGPKIAFNLISVRQLTSDHGLTVTFDENGSTRIFDKGKRCIHESTAKSLAGLPCVSLIASVTPTQLFHSRCGHPGRSAAWELINSKAVTGIPSDVNKKQRSTIEICKACHEAKAKRAKFSSAGVPDYAKIKSSMHTFAWDLVELRFESVDGCRYLLLI